MKPTSHQVILFHFPFIFHSALIHKNYIDFGIRTLFPKLNSQFFRTGNGKKNHFCFLFYRSTIVRVFDFLFPAIFFNVILLFQFLCICGCFWVSKIDSTLRQSNNLYFSLRNPGQVSVKQEI